MEVDAKDKVGDKWKSMFQRSLTSHLERVDMLHPISRELVDETSTECYILLKKNIHPASPTL